MTVAPPTDESPTTMEQFGSSTSVTNSDEAVSWSTAILISTLTGAAWHVLDPLLTRSLLSHFPPIKIVRPGWPIAALVTFAAGRLAFAHAIGGTEVVLAVVGWKGECSRGAIESAAVLTRLATCSRRSYGRDRSSCARRQRRERHDRLDSARCEFCRALRELLPARARDDQGHSRLARVAEDLLVPLH